MSGGTLEFQAWRVRSFSEVTYVMPEKALIMRLDWKVGHDVNSQNGLA